MSEYTSLEVSEQLAKAGFKKEKEGYPCDAIYMGKYGWSLDTSFVEQYASAKLAEYPAYRSDTLLTWLLSLDAKEVAEKMGVRTLAENGDRGSLRIEQIRIDFKGTLAYAVQLHRPVEMGAQGPVLVDVLGRLVCGVLGVTV